MSLQSLLAIEWICFGDTVAEKNAEEQRRTDQQEKCEKCTPEFEKMVKEKLT